ncbi:presenilin-like protein [Carex littledalei]|uniref:Presenilin n=1 Tax=Carex littledalei TaxID=544730 RepID=A0A833VN61_9POAL|nr:presenilin-like protein [Carex littledalei]
MDDRSTDSDRGTDGERSILDTLGEDIIRIVTPVSLCMLLVVLLVSSLSSTNDLSSSISSLFLSSQPSSLSSPNLLGSDSTWEEIKSALITAFSFVVVVTLLTFLLVLLVYFRCTNFLRIYMGISSLFVLSFLGGFISLLLISYFKIPIDPFTFAILLFNLSVIGVFAVYMSKFPISMNQGYLVTIGVLTAYWFTMLPEWTTWALLIAMSLYDLAAVLLPIGPLRLLVELAMSRNEEIPALVYEARPVDPQPGDRIRVWRERTDVRIDATENSTNLANVQPVRETRLVVSEEITAPLIETFPQTSDRQLGSEEEEGEGIGLSLSGAIKLGLGDFIFYSVLVGRAAMYDYMTVYACYLAIIAGLGVTLMLLAVYRQALPALPVSIMLGVVFYLLTRVLLEVFVVQCSSNLLMF